MLSCRMHQEEGKRQFKDMEELVVKVEESLPEDEEVLRVETKMRMEEKEGVMETLIERRLRYPRRGDRCEGRGGGGSGPAAGGSPPPPRPLLTPSFLALLAANPPAVAAHYTVYMFLPAVSIILCHVMLGQGVMPVSMHA